MKSLTRRSTPGLVLGTTLGLVLALGQWVGSPASAGTTAASVTRPGPLSVTFARKLTQPEMESRILALTNENRIQNGCAPLKHSVKLRKAARKHTVAMSQVGVMSHQLPGEAKFSTRITQAGYRNWRLVAENIARGFSAPESVMVAWMNSPSHRKNILNCRLRELGVGVVLEGGQLWWTQDFGQR